MGVTMKFDNETVDTDSLEETYVVPVKRDLLSSTATKTKFINLIYNWLMRTLEEKW